MINNQSKTKKILIAFVIHSLKEIKTKFNKDSWWDLYARNFHNSLSGKNHYCKLKHYGPFQYYKVIYLKMKRKDHHQKDANHLKSNSSAWHSKRHKKIMESDKYKTSETTPMNVSTFTVCLWKIGKTLLIPLHFLHTFF